MFSKFVNQSLFFKKGEPDYNLLNNSIKALKAASSITTSSVYLKDLYKNEFPYISLIPNIFEELTDEIVAKKICSPEKELISNEDFLFLKEFEPIMYQFIASLPVERRKYVVVTYKLNLRYKSDSSLGVILRMTPFLFDDAGNVWVMLCRVFLAPKNLDFACYIDIDDNNERYEYDRTGKSLFSVKKLKLTITQKKVLMYSNRGLLEKEICDEMGITLNTLKTHKRNLIRKLGADNIIDAYNSASMHRLV